MNIIKAVFAPAFFLVAGCVTYPYQSAFDSCDAEAGACYRYCEDVADNDYEYGRCHAGCEADANQCFAGAYDQYSYAGGYGGSYYQQPSWPWYGRYGAWGPSNGYYFDYNYWSGPNRYDRGRRGGRGRHRGGNDGGGGQPSGNRPSGNPPRGGRDDDRNRGGRSAPLVKSVKPSTSPPPVQQSAPPVQQSAPPPAQQASPPPAPQPKPADRPARPRAERGGSGKNQPEDY